MKIAIFNWRDIKNPKSGGAEIVTHEYAKGWIKAGHDVCVICPRFPGSLPQEPIDGVKYIRLGFNHPLNFLLIHTLIFYYYFHYLHGRINLVVDQIHWVPIFTPLFVSEKKLAFICEMADNIWQKQQFSFFLGVIGQKLVKAFFIPYKNISFWTICKKTKQDLVSMGIPAKNVTVTYCGIELNKSPQLSKKEKDTTFIFVGRISWVKNLEDILTVFKIVQEKIKKAKLWIVGRRTETEYAKKLDKFITDLEIKKSIKFWDFVTEEHKFDLLAKSHLLLHTSLTEGWGLVVIEAAAMGTPAVVYNVPGLSESVINGKTGVVCDQNTPEKMAKQVLELLSDNQKYRAMQKNCLTRSKEFSWKKSITKSLKLIENI